MIFAIPIYIEERSEANQPAPSFLVRPLFHPQPARRAEKLQRALSQLTGDLQQLLDELGREPRHDRLKEWTFHPLLEDVTLDLRLELASRPQPRRFFLAGYPALGRKLFFTPGLPELHFEVLPGQSVADRAVAVFTRYFRHLEKEEAAARLEEVVLRGKARLTTLELTLQPAVLARNPKPAQRALLFGAMEKMDGETELRKAGRPLHSLSPDDLDRALGREREVEELKRLLAAADRRPILLVGPRQVGKTAIMHELVWQRGAERKERRAGLPPVWLLSPMRLMSGMSYLGEWENRVQAILEFARAKDQVLYFDDLPGLLTAGLSCASDLNMAQVLRPALEKRQVRVVAEITPEGWRVLRERDRALADLFHLIPIHEPAEAETLRVLIHMTRQLEGQDGCEFGMEVVPTAFELHRRFGGDAAFPGKAAGFLRRLAARSAGAPVHRREALEEFHQQSGLRLAFLDRQASLTRPAILQALRAELAGQDQVLEAFADILVMLKARLHDPRRPLGTLLLLGPTGVGKTQSAKALARFLFGGEERLLRFDMNEYVDGHATPRLAGTRQEPDGLLTGAIRRQPFSVVLFDEIEKAAPEVYDLLLAVLDEGRLVDGQGRVADFTNSVILLTSNLGVREAGSRLGFGAGENQPEAGDTVFARAAEKFFRPEFFNRLDRIIPFRPLAAGHLESIARQLIGKLFVRDGLRRRECLLHISPEAMARLVELGQHPQLGARALKRVIEREIAQTLGERLAALSPGTPAIAHFGRQADQFVLRLNELRPVARAVFWPEAAGQALPHGSAREASILERINAALDRIEAELEIHAPSGRIELGNLPPEAARYFACREQLKKADRLAQAVAQSRRGTPRRPASTHLPKAKPLKFGRLRDLVHLQLALTELEAAEPVEVSDSPLQALCRELALLEAMTRKPWDDRPMALTIQPLEERDQDMVVRLAQCYHDFFANVWGVSASFLFKPLPNEELRRMKIFGERSPDSIQGLFLNGFNLRSLETGHLLLLRRADGLPGLLTVRLHDAPCKAEAEQAARGSHPLAGPTTEIDSLGPVERMIIEKLTMTDFRTGLVIPAAPSPEEFRTLLLSALPLPPEVIL